jgi:hypothetical protein
MCIIKIIELAIAFFTLVVAAVGLCVAFRQFMSELRKHSEDEKRQSQFLKLTFFTEFTKRYQEIMLHLPVDLETKTELTDMQKQYLRAYFDLCGEEYFLNGKGYIDSDIWSEWKEGITAIFKKNAVINYWKQYNKPDYPDFVKFIKNDILKEM